jgi:uncharacterized protein YcsI (UPF0317 family)
MSDGSADVEEAVTDTRSVSPAEARARFRAGLAVPSAGWSAGFTQANLVVLPRDWAWDMLLFGQRNPQPVPLLDVTDAGAITTELAPDSDLRTDLPSYRVWRDGALADEPADVADLGCPDFGDPVEAHEGDVPVFWACGVTPQAALMASRPPFAVTHTPGHMFVTDVPDSAYRQA